MKNKRTQISTRKRFEVFKRDLFTCQYCGSHPPRVILHVDHIIPVSKGGKNEMDNYVTSCDTCNLGKSNISLTSVPKSLKDKSLEIQERELQIKGYHDIINSKRNRIESEAWNVATILDSNASDGFRKDWYNTIFNFLEKLDYFEVLRAMEIATDKIRNKNYAFKYFCGICWNKIRDNG